MKTCIKCLQNKDLSAFYKAKSTSDGHRTDCILCFKKDNQRRFLSNREKINQANLAYYHCNKDDLKIKRKKYYLLNKEALLKKGSLSQKENRHKIAKRKRERLQYDINYKLACNLRNRLTQAVRNNYKSGSAVKDLGCSIGYFRQYIESLWEPGMTWENWGNGPERWQIDHIEALCLFYLSDPNQVQLACNFKNLKPIWHKDHVEKTQKDIAKLKEVSHL